MPASAETLKEILNLVPVIATAFAQGRVVPFLGAGASLVGRTGNFSLGTNFPSAGELANHLAIRTHYPAGWVKSLTRVSQYMLTRLGSGPLYSEVRGVFTAQITPSPLHVLLATITLRARKPPATVIITTNYDNLVEDALKLSNVPFDVLTYIARGKSRGLFRHTTSDGTLGTVIKERGYDAIPFNKQLRRLARPLVLKIHGTLALDENDDSFVITEEDYIDYLARTDVSLLLPTQVTEILAQKHFLFLGYSLADWNLRVLLSRVWQRQEENNYRSWAANRCVSDYDKDFWRQYEVDCHPIELGEFTATLTTAMDQELGPILT